MLLIRPPKSVVPHPEWSRAQALQLLQEVQKRPVLWEGKNPSFFGYASKEPVWDEVSTIMGFSKEECKRKMESLKGSFRRERRRIREDKSKTGGTFKPKWFAYEPMKFLVNTLDRQRRRRTVYTGQYNDSSIVDEDNIEYIEYEEETEDNNEADQRWETADDDVSSDIQPFSIVNVDDPLIDEEHFARKNAYDTSENFGDHVEETSVDTKPQIEDTFIGEEAVPQCACKDECATYGQHVANKLRKLDARSKAVVQHQINNLLFKAEMAMLET